LRHVRDTAVGGGGKLTVVEGFKFKTTK